MNDVVTKIMQAVKKAHKNELMFEEIFSADIPAGKNEFLMFIKPEILLDTPNLKTEEMIGLVFDKIKEFGLQIHGIKAVGAKYLDKNDIIAQHYGVINKIANDAKGNLSQGAREKFKEFFAKDISEVKVLGGFEFLNEYNEFTPYTADILFQAKQSKKLAGGTYVEDIKMDDETVYLVNGFHPRQIYHFTQSGRGIIVLTLSGDTAWEKVRDDMIGNTFPDKAVPGSIRGSFLAKKDAFGLAEVSIGVNGIHLSAGPIEGLIELIRYNSDFSNGKIKTAKDYAFGKKLIDAFGEATTDRILSNPNVDVDGKSVSVFDLTELKNADEAIEILKKHF
jgi:nucleoside diphosphate kinase